MSNKKDCRDCRYFVGCECFDGETCDLFIDKHYHFIPCEIGDTVYAIRNFSGTLKVRKGTVSEMYFIEGMRLCIVVKNVTRGEWGKTIFPSQEEALKAIEEGGK